ncbi:Uncharacterised protein [Escherichia coli]|uniref:Uncharacterized protein n=1 Tax=Escherichia coli TaxID=562 RepID=A0A376RMU2_ECOLX|nr:Uncharacterised protein [Escherichia coli]
MPVFVVVNHSYESGGKTIMSALCKSRMDEGKSGKTGDLTVKTSAFC